MKILLIGANGQLGTDIRKVFPPDRIIPLTHNEIEISDYDKTREVIGQYAPDVVINTAAYHNVPECEKHPQQAFLINAIGVRNLVRACRERDIKLLHISTDYVFDGKKKQPYTEDDIPNPLNVYAVSKLAGEFFARCWEKHYIIRVAGLFGLTGCRAKGGKNFVESMLELARTQETLSVTANIITSPTYSVDAAARIKEILDNNYPPGIYHIVNAGQCSWYEFALEIFRQKGFKVKVEPKTEEAEVAGVTRPLYSALTSRKLKPLRPWPEAISFYLKEKAKQYEKFRILS